MKNNESLPKIPKHLADQGVRWVEVRGEFYENNYWVARLLIEKLAYNKYVCVDSEFVDNYLKGKGGYPRVSWTEMREIEPKEEKCFMCKNDNVIYICDECSKKHSLQNIGTKIPYTAETFPCWAVWIRDKEDGLRFSICAVHADQVDCDSYGCDYECIDKYEIASSIPNKDGKPDWKPFYQLI